MSLRGQLADERLEIPFGLKGRGEGADQLNEDIGLWGAYGDPPRCHRRLPVDFHDR
jgi:hypothetical protein